MMSETSARASLLARWLGSLERNGLSGRRAPPSPIAGDAPGGVAGGAGGRAGFGRLAGVDGTNGGTDATGAEAVGGVNGETGAGAPGPGGVNGGTGGGAVNSGRLVAGDGGVAVAVTGPRSSGSWRTGRGAAGISAVRMGGGGAAGVGRCAGGAAGVWRAEVPNGGESQPLCAGGVERGRSTGAGGVLVRCPPLDGVVWLDGAGMLITPLHTEQRARTPDGGTFVGSTRKIERQSGQLTFIHSLR